MNKLTLSHDLPLLLAIVVLLLFVYMIGKPKEDFFKFFCYALLIVSLLLILFGCSSTKPGQCQPSKKSKDYAVKSYWKKQRSDGYWVHIRQEGFKDQTAFAFECKLDPCQLERFYDSIARVKY